MVQRAALQGYAKAQNRLSARYELGDGVEQNAVEALAWAILAVKQGHPSAIRRQDALLATLTGTDILAAKQRAAELPIAREE